jgi:putative membrane protein
MCAAIRHRAAYFPEGESMRLLLHWILSAIALIVVSHFVPGFHVVATHNHWVLHIDSIVSRFVPGLHIAVLWPALIASAVIGLLNATVGLFLKIITFPLTILTLGLFLLVINGVMILIASHFVPGFHVVGIVPAFWGAVVLALLGMLIRAVVKDA